MVRLDICGQVKEPLSGRKICNRDTVTTDETTDAIKDKRKTIPPELSMWNNWTFHTFGLHRKPHRQHETHATAFTEQRGFMVTDSLQINFGKTLPFAFS